MKTKSGVYIMKKNKNIFSNKKVPNATKTYVKKQIKLDGELCQSTNTVLGSPAAGAIDSQTTLSVDTWVSDSISTISQGDSSQNREGDKIEITGYLYFGTSILFPGVAQTDVSTVDLSEARTCRVVVIQLKRNATKTALDAALNNLDTAPTNSLKQFALEQLCYILYDKVFVDDSSYNIYSAPTEATSVYIKNPKLHIIKTYIKPKCNTLVWAPTSVTAVQPDIQGALYVYYLYNNSVSGTALSDVTVQETPDTRFTFRDK